MASKKGPQIYLNDTDPAEKDILEWADSLGKGRKSLATIEAIIAGRAIASVCQPISDILVAAARRGEVVSLQQLEDYITLFKSHGVASSVKKEEKTTVIKEEIKDEPVETTEESQTNTKHKFGTLGQ